MAKWGGETCKRHDMGYGTVPMSSVSTRYHGRSLDADSTDIKILKTPLVRVYGLRATVQ